MALRENLLPVFDKAARAKMESFGLRTHSLTVRTRTHLGTPGVDAFVDVDLVISPKPRIRELSTQEVSGTGGRYESGDIRVDKITPQYSSASGSGGYTPEQINPTVTTPGVEIIYVVTGPMAGEYALVDARVDRNFGYALVLRRKRATP